MEWVIWAVLGIVALVGEVLTLGLFFASLGVAAALTALVSLGAPVPVQIAVFCLLSLLMLFAVRPIVLPLIPRSEKGSDRPALGPVGQRGIVVEQVDAHRGQIRVGRGEFWSARCLTPDGVIAPGQEVEVRDVEGLLALVEPVPALHGAPPSLSAGNDSHAYDLSPRELEVLRLMAQGLSNGAIAERLVVSPRTVDHHVSHILDKMDAENRVEAVSRGIAAGLIGPRS